jgi:hypothetical protein
MNNTASCLLGILFTFICSTIPFIISSRQLSKEAKRLVTLSNLIIRGIEESGLAKFSRNANGEPVGMQFDMTVSDSLTLKESTTLSSPQAPATQPKA